MEHTGADYTNTFRWLSSVPMPAAQDTAIGDTSAAAAQGARDGGFLRRVLGSLPGPQRLAECIAPQMSLEVRSPAQLLQQQVRPEGSGRARQ